MPIEFSDVEELIQILRRDPDLRRRVFVALAPDEFLALPAKLDRLAEEWAEHFARIEAALERQAQEFVSYRQASEERFARIETALQALAESHQRLTDEFVSYRQASEERFARIEAALERQAQEFASYRQASEERFARIEAALERQAQEFASYRQASEERFARIEAALERQAQEFASYRQASEERLARIEKELAELVRAVRDLTEWQKVRDIHIDDLRGWRLEMHYAKHIHAYLGKVMRRVRLLSPPDIEEQVRQSLTGDEVVDIFSADIIARGRPMDSPDRDLYLVMEVSMVVDVSDVARARRRADLMRKAGYPCMAAVGGQHITEEAKLEAEHSHVLCALDGNLQGWDRVRGQAISSDPL
jgi:predicted  nucleic acid-binding Zn-ribbon protein